MPKLHMHNSVSVNYNVVQNFQSALMDHINLLMKMLHTQLLCNYFIIPHLVKENITPAQEVIYYLVVCYLFTLLFIIGGVLHFESW